MNYKLTDWEQKAMENIIAQVAKQHGKTEAEVRQDISELIVEAMKRSATDPVAAKLWKDCPCSGGIPTPEEFILWVSCMTRLRLEHSELDIWGLDAL